MRARLLLASLVAAGAFAVVPAVGSASQCLQPCNGGDGFGQVGGISVAGDEYFGDPAVPGMDVATVAGCPDSALPSSFLAEWFVPNTSSPPGTSQTGGSSGAAPGLGASYVFRADRTTWGSDCAQGFARSAPGGPFVPVQVQFQAYGWITSSTTGQAPIPTGGTENGFVCGIIDGPQFAGLPDRMSFDIFAPVPNLLVEGGAVGDNLGYQAQQIGPFDGAPGVFEGFAGPSLGLPVSDPSNVTPSICGGFI